jgi:hypothetical protein
MVASEAPRITSKVAEILNGRPSSAKKRKDAKLWLKQIRRETRETTNRMVREKEMMRRRKMAKIRTLIRRCKERGFAVACIFSDLALRQAQ